MAGFLPKQDTGAHVIIAISQGLLLQSALGPLQSILKMTVQPLVAVRLHQVAFDRGRRVLPVLQRQELIDQFLQIAHEQAKRLRRKTALREHTGTKLLIVVAVFCPQQNLVQPDYILTLIEKGECRNWEKRRCSTLVSARRAMMIF